MNHRLGYSVVIVALGILAGVPAASFAAGGALFIEPSVGVYPVGDPVTVAVRVDTGGESVGTADVSLAYDTSNLSFVSVSDEGSVFDTVVVDSTRTPGRVDISGVMTRGRDGYEGGAGLVAHVTFLPVRSSAATQLRVASGSARSTYSLAASVVESAGIVASLRNATYTLVPKDVVPSALAAVSYLRGQEFGITASASSSDGWYATSTLKLSWPLPEGVTGMRADVRGSEADTPATVYPIPLSSVPLTLTEGTHYFLLQFKRGDEWSEVVRHPLKVDLTPPTLTVVEAPRDDKSSGQAVFTLEAKDALSGMASRYERAVDAESFEDWNPDDDGSYRVRAEAGEHTLTVYAYDTAGNRATTSVPFTVRALMAPTITEISDRVLTGGTITVRGTSYPDATVTVYVSYEGGEAHPITVETDAEGTFVATVTDGAREGMYTVWLSVADKTGAVSPPSIKRSVTVSEPYIMLFGRTAVTYLSVIVPLLALVLLLALILWLAFVWARGYRARVRRETNEAFTVAHKEFEALRKDLVGQLGALEKANQMRSLTKEEMRIFNDLSRRLAHMEAHIADEIEDIERVEPPEPTRAEPERPAPKAEPAPRVAHTLRIERR